MSRRHLPRAWLFTDPRIGEALWPALKRLPRGTGVVVREPALAGRVRAVARRRGLVVTVAGVDHRSARQTRTTRTPLTASAHSRRELVAARRAGAALVFVSPLFATRTHPGATPLGRVRFGLLVRGAGVKVAALGGVDGKRFASLKALGAYGWGGIDAWLP